MGNIGQNHMHWCHSAPSIRMKQGKNSVMSKAQLSTRPGLTAFGKSGAEQSTNTNRPRCSSRFSASTSRAQAGDEAL